MDFPKLEPGDEFAVFTDHFFAHLINIRQKFRAADGEAEYTHYGIITSSRGSTFESKRKIDEYNLFDEYAGKKIIIFRSNASVAAKEAAIQRLIKRYKGVTYPWWRIILHSITPFLARKLKWSGIPVCSELGAENRYLTGTRHEHYMGATPDELVDEGRHWREFSIIYEGLCPSGPTNIC